MLPNWIIIGAPKCSTSSLFRWLADHPDVAGSIEKETYYFVDPGTHMFRRDRNFGDHGVAGYHRLFPDGGAPKVVLEATPAYLYSETALRELPQLSTQPQFLVVLREPVAQLRSLHRYFQQNWSWIPRSMSFPAFVAAADAGTSDFKGNELAANALANADYLPHLRRWRDAVGADRLEVVLFEDLVGQRRATMRRIAARMNIDPSFYDAYEFPTENATYVARLGKLQDFNVWLRARLPQGALYRLLRLAYRKVNTRPPDADEELRDPAVERALAACYAPGIAALEQEFGLDLSRWRAHPHAEQPLAASGLSEAALAPARAGGVR